MKSKLLSVLISVLFLFGMAGVVGATTLTSKINMDNGFQVFLSTSDTTAGNQFGAGNSWPTTYVHNTTLTSGVDYFLHVFGFDQGGPAGFLGEFSLSGTDHLFSNNLTTLLTNTVDWTGNSTGWAAAMTTLSSYGNNGVGPWGNRPAVSSSATWVWSGNNNAPNEANNQAYFSTKISAVTPVPEPSTLLLLGSGLAGLAWCGRKRKMA